MGVDMLGRVIRRALRQMRARPQERSDTTSQAVAAVAPAVSAPPSLERARSDLAAGRSDAALTTCRALLKDRGDDVEVLVCLGGALCEQGRADEALISLERARRLAPESAEVFYQLGVVEQARGKNARAEAHLHKSLKLGPGQAKALNNLGVLAMGREDLAAAADFFEHALRCDARLAAANCNLGSIRREQGEIESAVACFRDAVEAQPDLLEAHCNLALSLWDSARFQEAKHTLDRLVKLNPDYALAWRNAGIVYQACGAYDAAMEHFERALLLDPADTHARFGQAQIWLARRDYARGWAAYESRYGPINDPRGGPSKQALQPGGLDGRSVFLRGEQGIGDEIMFASCVPDLLRVVDRCVLECTPKIAALFTRSFPQALVSERPMDGVAGSARLGQEVDFEIPLGSLGLLYRPDQGAFPRHNGYLVADADRVRYWRSRLDSLGDGLKVGISWRGGTARTKAHVRSIPLIEWQPILHSAARHFVSLQYTQCAEEIDSVKHALGATVEHWPEAIENYDETAALVTALDLIISVQTAVIHLAGALGKKVWVLVPASPEWRYGAVGKTMDWYPAARLFRQEMLAHWEPVIERIASELADFDG